MLEVANLSLAYGLHRALDGVSLNVGPERNRDDPRRQWRRQDLASESHRRRRAYASGQAGDPRRPRYLRPRRARDRRKRTGAGPRGPRHFRRPHGEGKSPARRQSEARARGRSRAARAGARAVPAPARTRRPDRAHHERRRTADAGDRPRADVQSGYFAARRAVARALARHGAGIVRNACCGCARPASGFCSSSRTRRRACGSPIAAMCSKTASSSATAPPII